MLTYFGQICTLISLWDDSLTCKGRWSHAFLVTFWNNVDLTTYLNGLALFAVKNTIVPFGINACNITIKNEQAIGDVNGFFSNESLTLILIY